MILLSVFFDKSVVSIQKLVKAIFRCWKWTLLCEKFLYLLKIAWLTVILEMRRKKDGNFYDVCTLFLSGKVKIWFDMEWWYLYHLKVINCLTLCRYMWKIKKYAWLYLSKKTIRHKCRNGLLLFFFFLDLFPTIAFFFAKDTAAIFLAI